MLSVALPRALEAAQDAAPPAAAATPLVVTPEELQIGDAWLCKQVFGLCATAPCKLDAGDPSVANCHCVVVDAFALGFKTCAECAPSGMSVTSNISSMNVNNALNVMTCPEEITWANGLDLPSDINPLNPATATCQCQMVEWGPSLTWGSGCDTSTCKTTGWTAAPTSYLGLKQYVEGMKAVNRPASSRTVVQLSQHPLPLQPVPATRPGVEKHHSGTNPGDAEQPGRSR